MDSFFQLHNETIALKGLDRDYSILHISDVHLHEFDASSSREERDTALKSNRHWEKLRLKFGERFHESMSKNHLVTMTGYFERFVKLINQLSPDVVVITGDLMEEYSDSNIRYLSRQLPKIKVPVLLVQGNHERGEQPAWNLLYGAHPDWQALNIGKLKLIALNNSQHTVSKEAVLALVAEASANDGQVPVLCTHIPFCTPDCAAYWDAMEPYFTIRQDDCDTDSTAFFNYFLSSACPITLNLCGHIHGRSTTTLCPGKQQMTASSAMLGGCTLLTLTPAL